MRSVVKHIFIVVERQFIPESLSQTKTYADVAIWRYNTNSFTGRYNSHAVIDTLMRNS